MDENGQKMWKQHKFHKFKVEFRFSFRKKSHLSLWTTKCASISSSPFSFSLFFILVTNKTNQRKIQEAFSGALYWAKLSAIRWGWRWRIEEEEEEREKRRTEEREEDDERESRRIEEEEESERTRIEGGGETLKN